MKKTNQNKRLVFLVLSILVIGSWGWISTSQAEKLDWPLSTSTKDFNPFQSFFHPNFFNLNFFHGKHAAVCSTAGRNAMRCNAQIMIDSKGRPQTATLPSGYGPAQFLGAYNLGGIASSAKTIAIVDAYDDPNILSDLNNYSSTFGISPLKSCPISGGSASSPCFQKVNERGGISYPRSNSGWALETSLDVEVAHAVCQNCNILLVEANSSSYSDLMTSVDRAVAMGANVVSNSYGSNEFSSETAYDSHFNHPGIAFTFSSGDSGYGPEYPAASPYVTAVGGTTLNLSGNSYSSETAWSGSGSGCSAYETQPGFQASLIQANPNLAGCAKRMIADVSADADPNTGGAVYDSVSYMGMRGWFQVGGTSLSSPIVAATYALGGIGSGIAGNSVPYNNSGSLHDVTSGSNGKCNLGYLCTAGTGYDGPTGLGTPKGSGAF